MSCILKQGTVLNNYVEDSGTKKEVRAFQEMKKMDEAIGERNHSTSQRKENKLLVKGVTHCGSGMLLAFLSQ